MFKLLLRRNELIDVIYEFRTYFVIIADRDKKPLESIKGLINSLGLQVIENRGVLNVKINEHNLSICIIQQGHSGEGSTGQIEDNLRELIETIRLDLRRAINNIEDIMGSLNDKQKLMIYLALLERRIKFRNIHEVIKDIIEELDVGALRSGLKDIIRSLESLVK